MSEEAYAWWRDAVCAQIGSDLFFLREGEPGNEAKRACRDLCAVRVNCLADACRNELEHGIFGGFGRDVRRKLTDRIEAGEHPIAVAVDAIKKEKADEQRRADHRAGVQARGRRDRLRASAGGRQEERPRVAAQRAGADGL